MLHGILIVDKPAYVTSAGVVQKVRRKTGTAKAGHTGTLDPLATGVLPICLGAACKLAGYLIAEDKGYEAELELGRRTTTLDRTGEVIEDRFELADEVTDLQLEEAVARWRGAHEQMPPMYSAIKQDGVRLYEQARAGREVTRTPRSIVIHRLEIVRREGRRVALSVSCSKGTFVRSLVDDIGAALGCGANLTELRRTQSGNYTLEQSVALDDITVETAAARMIPVAKMLPIPSIAVPRARHQALRDGRPDVLRDVWGELVRDRARDGQPAPDGMMQLVSEAGHLLALIECRSTGPEGGAAAEEAAADLSSSGNSSTGGDSSSGGESSSSADSSTGGDSSSSADSSSGGDSSTSGDSSTVGDSSASANMKSSRSESGPGSEAATIPAVPGLGTSTIPSAFSAASGPGARYLRVFPEGFVPEGFVPEGFVEGDPGS